MEIDTIGTLEMSPLEELANQQAVGLHMVAQQQAAILRAQSGQASGMGVLGQLAGFGGVAFGALNTQLGQAASQSRQNFHPGSITRNPNFHRSLQVGIEEVFEEVYEKPTTVQSLKDFYYRRDFDSKLPDKDHYKTSLIDRLLYYKSKIMLSIGERIIHYCGD